MIDLQNRDFCPDLDEIGIYIKNPVFQKFCTEIKTKYSCKEKIEFSSCTMERGWNVKFKKSGRTLCTIYPRELFFTVMVVIGQKEKETVTSILPDCSERLQEIYHQTKEGNGQRWLMIDLEDQDSLYDDVLKLVEIRRQGN